VIRANFLKYSPLIVFRPVLEVYTLDGSSARRKHPRVDEQAQESGGRSPRSRPPLNQSLVWTNGVADGRSHVNKVAGGVVVRVIDHVVVAHFRPDENMSPHVVPDAGSHVDLEVV
jgi:hypothetical protein